MKDKKKAAEDLFCRIGYGRESRVERPRNRAVDRSLRRMIGEWNEHSDNDTIINVGDGYYKPRLSVPDEKLECKQYIAQETARAYRVLDKIKPMWAAFERMDKYGKREEEGESRGAGSGEDFTQLRLPL
jgi:hypothetical protein